MHPYTSPSRDTGVTHYENGPDFIRVRFRDGSVYRYGPAAPGREHVEAMQQLAAEGRGLTTYINQHVRDRYEAKESSGG